MYDQKWPNLENIATELILMAKYSKNIPEKNSTKYEWGIIFKTHFEVDLPFNTFWFQG